MRKILRLFIFVLLPLAVLSCDKAVMQGEKPVMQGDLSLLGRAVNFNASHAEDFAVKASYNHDGKFNEGDVMTIYRQYWDDESSDWGNTDYRVYYFKGKYASGINLSLDWKVYPGRLGGFEDGSVKEQSDKDSLVWDNGKTVRFRAWCRSNLANVVNGSTFYPDYCMSDWVTVSGPSQAIPLTLKHVGCRIAFDEKAGNEISSVRICTDLADYVWDDNSDSYDNDQQDKEIDPQVALASVLSVYNKMCMPAGVDMENYFINAMTKDLYDRIQNNTGDKFPNKFANFEELCEKNHDSGIVPFGTRNSIDIANNVKRPEFIRLDGRSYMITSPYDMSSESTNGDVLVLPACTRFKISLYDVNSGKDKEHIFALKDIKRTVRNSQGENVVESLYKDGLPLLAGHSFLFTVGYQYDRFTVDVLEEDMKWSAGASSEVNVDKDVPQPVESGYEWWRSAIYAAAVEAGGTSKNFNPVFHIKNETQFEEFINLVNGTTPFKKNGLDKAHRAVNNPEADPLDNDAQKRMYWYRVNYDENGTRLPIAPSDTVWVTKAAALAEGYIFYRKYHPQISTTAAYSEDWYLDGPYSFYHEQLNAHFTVKVDADIDFKDRLTVPVGNTESTPFKGYFDANMHLLSNLYVDGAYLFRYAEDADIRNVRVESNHHLSILYRGLVSSAKNMHIVGVSLKAPSVHSPIADRIAGKNTNTGRSYVIGCIYEGNSEFAMVGYAEDMTMYGCMNIAPNVSGASLLADGPGLTKFNPQTNKVVWNGYFECNYFLREPGTASAKAKPVPSYSHSDYKPQQYIRGVRSYILDAVTDNLLASDVKFDELPDNEAVRAGFYGVAPFRAMNYAIQVAYNLKDDNLEKHPCSAHYTVDTSGYGHRHPVLVTGAPASGTDYSLDPVAQNN